MAGSGRAVNRTLSRIWAIFALLLGSAAALDRTPVASLDLDLPHSLSFEHRKMEELVLPLGYPLEEHFVTTADGYVLGVYRIPCGRAAARPSASPACARPPGPPVLLMHGLLDSSGTWVVNFPGQSLGFILADAGYDVWLGNSRGNAFSRNHTGFDPGTAAFWAFTFDDMADFDLPALAAAVLKETGRPRLALVAHSQGSTQTFAALSSGLRASQMRDQVAIFAALGPAAFVATTASTPLRLLAELHTDQLFDLLGQHEFLPARKATADIFGEVCRASPIACVSVLTAICGFNERNLNITRLPVYVAYAPSGTSVKNMAHWAQLIRRAWDAGRPVFGRYDYGQQCNTPRGAPRDCNRRAYGADRPPRHDLSQLTGVPIALFSGGQDKLADPQDVAALAAALPPGAVVFARQEPSYQHVDFTWGVDAAEKVYPDVLELLRRYLPLDGSIGG